MDLLFKGLLTWWEEYLVLQPIEPDNEESHILDTHARQELLLGSDTKVRVTKRLSAHNQGVA